MPGSVHLPLPVLYGFLLTLARVAGVITFVPLPGIRNGPDALRAMMALAITGALYPLWPANLPAEVEAGRLAIWIVSEAAFGVTAGVAIGFLLDGLCMAAQMAGLQAGYSYASTIDPNTQADNGVLVVCAQLAGGLLFFALGLHRDVLRIFASSLAWYPPGAFSVSPGGAAAILGLGSAMFSTGLRLALPVLALLISVDIALALMGRIHAQLQLLTLAFPLKIMVGLAVLAATLPLCVPMLRNGAELTFTTLLRVLRG